MSETSTDRAALEAMRQQNIGRLLQRAARAYSELAVIKLQARGYPGITLFHTALISNLDTAGTRITILAERAGITKQAMGQLVTELEQGGYIRRHTDPDDKRAVVVQFTDAGWRLLEASYQIKLEIEADYTATLGEDGMLTLRHLLEQLTQTQNPV